MRLPPGSGIRRAKPRRSARCTGSFFGVVIFGADMRADVGIDASFLKITLKLPQQPAKVGQQ
jgi:hypothetical protein